MWTSADPSTAAEAAELKVLAVLEGRNPYASVIDLKSETVPKKRRDKLPKAETVISTETNSEPATNVIEGTFENDREKTVSSTSRVARHHKSERLALENGDGSKCIQKVEQLELEPTTQSRHVESESSTSVPFSIPQQDPVLATIALDKLQVPLPAASPSADILSVIDDPHTDFENLADATISEIPNNKSIDIPTTIMATPDPQPVLPKILNLTAEKIALLTMDRPRSLQPQQRAEITSLVIESLNQIQIASHVAVVRAVRMTNQWELDRMPQAAQLGSDSMQRYLMILLPEHTMGIEKTRNVLRSTLRSILEHVVF